jgi:2-polyprenyl-6-methoxyphenol hydroxylase-like FAD-dependent oxidoreductase
MSQAHHTKIIVIGAEPVGCFVAYRLGKQGIPVTILEKEPALPYTPRAVGYYGATQVALKSAGLYDLVREAGFLTSGLCWRTTPVDDGTGHNKVYGEMIAGLPLSDSTDPGCAYPSGLLNLRQSELTQLLLREALATGLVTIHFQAAVEAITDRGEDRVVVTAKNPATDLVSTYIASYLVGADGGKSQTRKLLNIPCLGHTWPERLISTDVLLHNREDPVYHTCYVVGTDTPTILTPLSPPHLNTTSLWRYTMMVLAGDSRSDDELLSEENIRNYYEELMVGPRPLQVEIAQRAVYRIHQRLVATMRRGRCVLVGDAAHLNNVRSPPSPSLQSLFSLFPSVLKLTNRFNRPTITNRVLNSHTAPWA